MSLAETDADTPSKTTPRRLTALVTCLILCSVSNIILFRIMIAHLGNYPVMINIMISFLFMLLLMPLLAVVPRTAHDRATPMKVFVVYALLDGASSFLATVGAVSISGPVQLLLGKFDIISVMAGSRLLASMGLLVTHFYRTHYAGAALILGGVLLTVVPKLIQGGDEHNTIYGIALYASASLPATASMLYKEYTMKRYRVGAFYANAWTTPWQFLVSITTLPLMTLAPFGTLALHDLGPHMRDGFLCLFAARASHDGDECVGAQLIMAGYVTANVVANMLMLASIRAGSSTIVIIAGAVTLPLANLLFTQRWLMHSHAAPMSITEILALLVILCGFILYKFKSDQAVTTEEEEDDGEPGIIPGAKFVLTDNDNEEEVALAVAGTVASTDDVQSPRI